MTRNRIPRRNLSERDAIIARERQLRAVATYDANVQAAVDAEALALAELVDA